MAEFFSTVFAAVAIKLIVWGTVLLIGLSWYWSGNFKDGIRLAALPLLICWALAVCFGGLSVLLWGL